MFGFVQWDNPLSLLLEILLSVAVIVVVMWLARLADRRNAGAVREPPLPDESPPHERPGPGQTKTATRDMRQDPTPAEDNSSNPSQPGHES